MYLEVKAPLRACYAIGLLQGFYQRVGSLAEVKRENAESECEIRRSQPF